ncbi:hypothetical protein [Leptospira stimsonii]|uniref:hypothetical protein n=1 Tax=Leptospira stimsonii TaxID=2202203 RepID=UPI001314BF9E|nr:hypothetical protein [Leptospira stimsonii]
MSILETVPQREETDDESVKKNGKKIPTKRWKTAESIPSRESSESILEFWFFSPLGALFSHLQIRKGRSISFL